MQITYTAICGPPTTKKRPNLAAFCTCRITKPCLRKSTVWTVLALLVHFLGANWSLQLLVDAVIANCRELIFEKMYTLFCLLSRCLCSRTVCSSDAANHRRIFSINGFCDSSPDQVSHCQLPTPSRCWRIWRRTNGARLGRLWGVLRSIWGG